MSTWATTFARKAVGAGWTLGWILLLAGCGNMKNQRGARDVIPDASIRLAPAHTVTRDAPAPGNPTLTGFGPDGQPLARLPLPLTSALLQEGRDRFTIYCAVCHGDDGYGQGIVVRRGFPAPPSYHDDRLRQAADGHLYDVMTRGYGVMLPLADRLTAEERWSVVAYIRALQRSQHMAWEDLPALDRAHFKTP